MNLREEPKSEETEAHILGNILNTPSTIYQALSILDVEDFYFSKNRAIYKAMKELSVKGKEPCYITTKDYLETKKINYDPLYLSKLDEVGGVRSMLENECKIVKNKSTIRKVINLFIKKLNECYRSDEALEVINSTHEKLCDINMDHTQKTKKDLVSAPNEWVSEAIQSIEHSIENPNIEREGEIKTTYKDLEEYTGGARSINVISAYSGYGKTALALNLATQYAVDQKIPTLYLNYEMAKQELSNRVVAIVSGQAYKDIEGGSYRGEQAKGIKDVREALTKLTESPLYLTGKEAKNITTTVSLIEKFALSSNIKVVFIDYLGEIFHDSLSAKESEYITFGRYIALLSDVCDKYGIKLWLLVQQGRGDNKGKADGVQGSIKILQKADQFIVLDRSYDKEKTYIQLEKNRHGSYPYRWEIPFDKSTLRIKANNWKSIKPK